MVFVLSCVAVYNWGGGHSNLHSYKNLSKEARPLVWGQLFFFFKQFLMLQRRTVMFPQNHSILLNLEGKKTVVYYNCVRTTENNMTAAVFHSVREKWQWKQRVKKKGGNCLFVVNADVSKHSRQHLETPVPVGKSSLD